MPVPPPSMRISGDGRCRGSGSGKSRYHIVVSWILSDFLVQRSLVNWAGPVAQPKDRSFL